MDPYKQHGLDPVEMYVDTSPISGSVSAVMDFRLPEREFELIPSPTRVLKTHDVHEFILVDEEQPSPGETVTGATYLGFVEISQGGLAVVGDEIRRQGEDTMAEIVGFDRTHSPNHLNVICTGDDRTGHERGLSCGDLITIERS